MNKVVDLHTHSTASDGLYHPYDLVKYAKEKGLAAIAVTDHDVVGGVSEAIEQGEKMGVEVIPGVEISTRYEDAEIHMLGLFIDPTDSNLLQTLMNQRNVRAERNKMVIRLLNELGIPITLEEVQAKRKDETKDLNVGRPHIAEVLVEKGFAISVTEAFDLYLGKGKMAYASPERISPIDAIEVIHQAGGVAVIAHPGIYHQDEILPKLIEAGLDGIEYSHPDHSEEDRKRYLRFAEEHDLIYTAGSDFHGSREEGMYHADLGTCTVPYEQVIKLKEKQKKYARSL